jgi:hypothetical protein
MNRRILLIDPDVQFRDLLVRELARYKVGVESVDGDQAVASAVAAPPALIVIAADEPDKQGFKTFQKCRKAIAKVPIAMVTSSVAPASFKRHAEGKVHAELYLDKRGIGGAELIAKLDSVIGLGAPEDDLGVPVDVDEIPLDIDGNDAVVDETVGDERGFDDPHSALTVGPPRGAAALRLDSQVDAELDATFAALLGDDSTAVPIIGEAAAVPEPIAAEPEPEPTPPLPSHEEDAAAAPAEVIHDSGHHTPAVEELEPPPTQVPAEDAARDALAAIDDLEDDEAAAGVASPVIEDVAAEDVPVEDAPLDHEPVEDAPLDHEPAVHRARAEVVDDAEDVAVDADDDGRHEFDSSPAIALDVGDIESFEEERFVELPVKQPRFVEATTAVETPPEPPPEPRPRILQARTGVDLGLDVLAEAAERDQSGVHDRRQLRQLGELERQVAQLKSELERARHDANAAPAGGREREFLGLREQLATRDRELREVRDQLGTRERVLADVRDELRQARTAHQTAAGHANELAQRVAALETAETAHRAATTELAAAQRELDARTAALAAAETARQQAERDVATERAARAASASEAERILRGERDQLVARHRAELDAERDRAANDKEAALVQLRLEYDAVQADAIAAAVKAARADAEAEHARARAAADADHARARADADADHAETLARARTDADATATELAAQLERMRADAADAAAELQRRHDGELAAQAAGHAEQVKAAEQAGKAQLAAQAEQHREALERAQAEALDAATSAAAEHANAIEALEREHAAALADRDQAGAAHDRNRLAAAQAHAEAVAELRGQLDAVRAELDGARGELASQAESHEAARTALVTEHRATLDGALAAHEAALSRARSQGQHELDKATRAHAAELDKATKAHAAELDKATKAHAAELERASKAHSVELATAKADADKAAAVARADRDRAAADHDRALATARAEHDRAAAAAEAAHARTAADLTGERDELRRGLSSARDALRRVEGELASAVQTIADRNAELRAHAAGIAERDQRIAELRREVEAIEQENAQYQEQVLRAYQRIKTDEATVARAKKALAIALTALDQPAAPNGPATSPHGSPSDAKAK